MIVRRSPSGSPSQWYATFDAVARLDVTVDAVEADVELAAQVPLRVRRLPVEELGERLEPGDPLARLGLPELVEVALVDVGLRVRLRGEVLGRRIPPLLEEHRLDGSSGRLRQLTASGRTGSP